MRAWWWRTCASRKPLRGFGEHGMSSATFYAWKSKHGGLELSGARRLRGLEEEHAKLKRLLAEAMLGNAGLKDLLGIYLWSAP